MQSRPGRSTLLTSSGHPCAAEQSLSKVEEIRILRDQIHLRTPPRGYRLCRPPDAQKIK